MVLIQQSQRRTGAWLIQPGPEMILEISVWELECYGIPTDKLDAAFRRGWDSWDGKGAFNAWDVLQAYRAQLRDEEQAANARRERWIREHPGEYLCERCQDTKARIVWAIFGGSWKGGAQPCKCDKESAEEWARGNDGSWARVADLAKYGPPHRGFSHDHQNDEGSNHHQL